jgi:putative hydrolase of the HAD superfamily
LLPRAVLFDLDDTLVDRGESLARFSTLFGQLFARHLVTAEPGEICAVIRTVDGGGYQSRERVAQDLARLLPWRTTMTSRELLDCWNEHFPVCSAPTTGLYETLGQLRAQGVKLGIVTNGRMEIQMRKIDCLSLGDLVDCIVISEAVGMKKPDARIFDLARANLHVLSEQAWFVGDHPINDVLGASAAGMTSVWFRRDAPWPDDYPPPRWSIMSLAELLPLLESLGSDEPITAST